MRMQEAMRPLAVDDLLPVIIGTLKAMVLKGTTKTRVANTLSILVHLVASLSRLDAKSPFRGSGCDEAFRGF
jgi:hypothetical protein